MIKIEEISSEIASFHESIYSDPTYFENLEKKLESLRIQYVKENKQNCAKCTWIYRSILRVQYFYILAYEQIKSKEYYKAWCNLEFAEKKIMALKKHYDFSNDQSDRYSLKFIEDKVRKIQGLYPYTVFSSPCIRVKSMICSVCGSVNTVITNCGHIIGEIYDGYPCVNWIKEFDMDHVAIVTNPEWKYRVPFDKVGDDVVDNYDYSVLEEFIQFLNGPFKEWDFIKTTKIYPHSTFSKFSPTDPCPCGSMNRYSDCCLKKEGVPKPHIQFSGDFDKSCHGQVHIHFPLEPSPEKEKSSQISQYVKTIDQNLFFIE